ncbi:MAG: hypothetical protein M3R69_07580 [Acidobacteriota bacterium]|nr:hypothetical protein [Acidobacteriota bacterium]
MYCPRCSQQQTSDVVRFCPGCGFQLNVVAELLSTNGALITREAETRKKVALLERKGVRVGAKLLFLSLFLLPLAILLSVAFDSPGPFVLPFIVFLLGSAKVLYTLLFGEQDRFKTPAPLHAGLSATKRRFDLPKTTPIPINEPKRINTAEMVRPSSVTEHTTQLLDDDQLSAE